MDESVRTQCEGFRPGMYVRVEVMLQLFSHYSWLRKAMRIVGNGYYQCTTSLCNAIQGVFFLFLAYRISVTFLAYHHLMGTKFILCAISTQEH